MSETSEVKSLLEVQYKAEMALLQFRFRSACSWDAPIYYPPEEGLCSVMSDPQTLHMGAGTVIYHYIYYRPEIRDDVMKLLSMRSGSPERQRALGALLGYFCPTYLHDPACKYWGHLGIMVKFIYPGNPGNPCFKVPLMYQRIDSTRVTSEQALAMRARLVTILGTMMPFEYVHLTYHLNLLSPLPPEIMGRIAAYADTGTRRAMIKAGVVRTVDVLYQLPPECLSYTDIRDYAMKYPIPNKYDSHLRAIARAFQAYIKTGTDGGTLCTLNDKIYAAMAYYLLTDRTRGLKLSDIRDLFICKAELRPGLGHYRIKRHNRDVIVMKCGRMNEIGIENGRTTILFMTDGEKHREDGPSSIVYEDITRTVVTIAYYNMGEWHRVGRPALFIYSDGRLYIEEYHNNNKIHRSDGPAHIMYWPNGKVRLEGYYNEGLKHNSRNPAEIYYNEDGSLYCKNYWKEGCFIPAQEFAVQ